MRYLTKRNRAILREMISTDFKVRYQGSALGYLWSLLRPLFMFGTLYIIFVYIFNLNKGVPHLGVFLLLGIVMWNFFLETTMIGMSSVVARGDLIRKISIPRYLVVVSSSVGAFINLFLNLMVVLVFALFDGVQPSLTWLLFPLLIVELYIFSTAVAFLLAALYVKFRDITYVWEVLTQAAFYGTPILYALAAGSSIVIPVEYMRLLLISPLAQIIQDARYSLVTHDTITGWSIMRLRFAIIPVLIVAALSILSYWYFKRQARTFAEDI